MLKFWGWAAVPMHLLLTHMFVKIQHCCPAASRSGHVGHTCLGDCVGLCSSGNRPQKTLQHTANPFFAYEASLCCHFASLSDSKSKGLGRERDRFDSGLCCCGTLLRKAEAPGRGGRGDKAAGAAQSCWLEVRSLLGWRSGSPEYSSSQGKTELSVVLGLWVLCAWLGAMGRCCVWGSTCSCPALGTSCSARPVPGCRELMLVPGDSKK